MNSKEILKQFQKPIDYPELEFSKLPEKLRSDRDFVLEILKIIYSRYIPPYHTYHTIFKSISGELKKNYDFCKSLIEIDYRFYDHLPKEHLHSLELFKIFYNDNRRFCHNNLIKLLNHDSPALEGALKIVSEDILFNFIRSTLMNSTFVYEDEKFVTMLFNSNPAAAEIMSCNFNDSSCFDFDEDDSEDVFDEDHYFSKTINILFKNISIKQESDKFYFYLSGNRIFEGMPEYGTYHVMYFLISNRGISEVSRFFNKEFRSKIASFLLCFSKLTHTHLPILITSEIYSCVFESIYLETR